MSIDIAKLGHSALAPKRIHRPNSGKHFVLLYEDDSALIEPVTTFISTGITAGDVGMVVMDEPHRLALEAALDRAGVDLPRARDEGRFLAMDASEVLLGFMVNGLPDEKRFTAAIGSLISGAGEGDRNVRVFGEMVAVLWAEGNIAGALALEELWNGLAESHPFQLFCAYPAGGFEDHLAPLREICRLHTHVIPPR